MQKYFLSDYLIDCCLLKVSTVHSHTLRRCFCWRQQEGWGEEICEAAGWSRGGDEWLGQRSLLAWSFWWWIVGTQQADGWVILKHMENSDQDKILRDYIKVITRSEHPLSLKPSKVSWGVNVSGHSLLTFICLQKKVLTVFVLMISVEISTLCSFLSKNLHLWFEN